MTTGDSVASTLKAGNFFGKGAVAKVRPADRRCRRSSGRPGSAGNPRSQSNQAGGWRREKGWGKMVELPDLYPYQCY